jgi:hypothetical protein
MKKYIFVSIIIVFVGCKNSQQDNGIVIMHNFSVPETLLFELNTQTCLTGGVFNPNIADNMKKYPLYKEATKQLAGINHKVYSEHSIRQSGAKIYLDTDSLLYEHCRFYICGKLDLQADVESFVLLEQYRDSVFCYLNSISLWLFNLKEDKLCSIALLAFDCDEYIDRPLSDSNTCLKNGIFTETRISTKYFFIENIGQREWNSYEVKTRACYRINESGFIEFLKN